jgi:hypothetical protein
MAAAPAAELRRVTIQAEDVSCESFRAFGQVTHHSLAHSSATAL